MLRIEKVFLQGFKSFCDPTEIVFAAEGITAVVGPNGCGKSNVADALSWVIGEQRAKALRGGKMEDVIFQGSRHRPPSGRAEVLLTMRVATAFEIRPQDDPGTGPTPAVVPPNTPDTEAPDASAPAPPLLQTYSKPALPAPSQSYQEGERITIARRLYRTGESEYEMNGRSCRLRDIQDLFAGTGLGGAHYAIIEQGRIGQVLSAKPLDRRALIEEAAGISKFKLRQRAAELKLEAAKQNLSRVTDIIAEVERQQGALKRQAAKARRYQRMRGEMRELMKAVWVADFRTTQQSLTELDDEKQSIHRQEADISSQIAQTEATRQTTLQATNQLDLTLTQAREKAAQTNLQLEKTYQQQRYCQAQIHTLTTRAQQSSQDQSALSARGHLTAQESEKLRARLHAMEQEINTEAASLTQAEKFHRTQSSHAEQAEQDLDQAQRQVTEAATHRERWKQLERQFAEALERCERTLAGLGTEHQRASELAQKLAQELSDAACQVVHTTQMQTDLLAQLAASQQALHHKQAAAAEIDHQLRLLQQQQTIAEQRLKSLLELDERRAYFSPPVQALMQETKPAKDSKTFHIIGTFADFIKVNPKDEALVEAGLKEELQYLITPSFEDALLAIEFLKREQLGRATFLVLNTAPNGYPSEPEAAGQIVRLIDLLGVKPELRALMQQALPKLSQTVLTAEVRQAIADSISSNGKGHSFLTTTGEMVSAGHIISGGSSAAGGTGVLALKREIEQLQAALIGIAEQLSTLTAQEAPLKAEVLQLQTQSNELDFQTREIEKELVRQRGSQQQHEREQERTAAHRRVIAMEITQAEQEQTELAAKLRHSETELQQAESALRAAENRAAEAQASGLEIRRQATERTTELSRRRADFAAKSERRKGLQNDLKRLENEAQDITKRLTRAQSEALEAAQQAQSLHDSLDLLGTDLASWQKQQQVQSSHVEALSTELAQEKEKLLGLEKTSERSRATLSELRELRAELDITRTRLTASLEYLETACQAELGEDIQTLLVQAEQPPTDHPPAHLTDDEEAEADEEEMSTPVRFHPLPGAFDLEAGKTRLQELRTKVESLGPVNFLALDELGELAQRLLFLLEQKADIEQAVSDTFAAIAELKRRSRERFVTAFHHINQNFSAMFLELFGGGHAEMRLIDETDVLESGIDIIAQPPGKRLQNVLLLSGGEKAMAALALVLGIFKHRPSPFCLLDEVDAPLDDVNIGRFSAKILELSQQTQFMVITHSKRTMEVANTLYGVTMEDPGVSKIISVRLT